MTPALSPEEARPVRAAAQLLHNATVERVTMKLVRAWDREYNLRGQQFVTWNQGTFTIKTDDPLALELWDNRELGHQITVESTDEMAWWIDRIDRTNLGTLIVTCKPHVDVMRDCTTPDWKLTSAWLEAEKVYRRNRRTWRIIGREVAQNIHPSIDGQDCYVFKRDGGSRPTDVWSVTWQPVAKFWKHTDPRHCRPTMSDK